MIIIEHSFNISRFKKIIFLDRDGVINLNEKAYVTSKHKIKIINRVVDAMKVFISNGIGIIIISNQQAIGKGIITVSEAVDIHLEVLKKLKLKDSPIIASFICPHLSTEGCECRKPGIKMIRTAQTIFNVDSEKNYYIGDSSVDIETAKNSGLIPIYIGEKRSVIGKNVQCFEDLFEVSKYICF